MKIISSILMSTIGVSIAQANDSAINSLNPYELTRSSMALDNAGSAPVQSTIILIVAGLIGLYFAKKHHEVAKRHQEINNRRSSQ